METVRLLSNALQYMVQIVSIIDFIPFISFIPFTPHLPIFRNKNRNARKSGKICS